MISENTINTKQGNVNRTIQTIVATLGVIFGIGGMSHAFLKCCKAILPRTAM